MKTLLRIACSQHRAAIAWCAALTALAGLAVHSAMPERWVVVAEVAVREPVAIHRLANPFAPTPREDEGLSALPQELTSHDRLVALVKRTGLVDQWDSARPWPLHLKDLALARLFGPATEKDRLEALVAMLERRFAVTVIGNVVHLSVEWPSPQAAFGLAEAALESLKQQRDTQEITALETASRALEEQRAGVQAEIATRVTALQRELERAASERRPPVTDAQSDQLVRDQQRAAELTMREEEKTLTAAVLRRANGLRFNVIHPPMQPRRPEGAGPFAWAAVLALVSLLAGLGGALTVTLAGGQLSHAGQVTRELGLPVLGALNHGGPSPPQRSRAWPLAAGLALVTGFAVGASRGNPALALAPLLAAAGAWQLWVRPLKWPVLALLLLAVTIDDPTDRPYAGLWQSPLHAAGRIFFANVAWFTGFELCVMGLLAMLVSRRILRSGRHPIDPVQPPAPKVLRLALVLSFATVGWLIALGLARGGDFREALWQFRAPLMMPLLCLLALEAFEFPRDLRPLAAVLVTGTVVKALLGAYFIRAIASPQGATPPHTTGHNDTMIFVTATVLALLLVWEAPGWRRVFPAVLLAGLAFLAMVLNDRRIAYVDIAISLAFIFAVSPWHAMKRRIARWTLVLLPVLALYGAAGWSSRGGKLFSPVQKVRSILSPPEDTRDESSNVERDIENFNLSRSWEANMFLGQGFGHAFTEYVPSNDFGQSNFGHIGHNSVLWLLWIGGITGYTGVLIYLAIAIYLLARSLAKARAPRDRVALLLALSILLTYLMQSFGDMGMLAMQFDFFVAIAVAIAGHFATRLDALAPLAAPAAVLRSPR